MQNKKTNLTELAALFIRLGLTAFGGPAAHIAMMQKEVVDKRQWMDHQHFMDLIGATNLIPGPNSTEMAIHIGHPDCRTVSDHYIRFSKYQYGVSDNREC